MKVWGWLIAIGFIVFLTMNDDGKTKLITSGKEAAPVFSEPAQPLPSTGLMDFHSGGIAPLQIKTRDDGYHYLVKVVYPGTTESVGQMFIRSGESVEIQLPLGTYELRYASGKTWYGLDHRFGPETRYSKADKQFDFVDNGYQVSGYTVELYTQVNGNLHTSGIPANQF